MNATNYKSIRGSMRATTPKTMRMSTGTTITKAESGFSIIPLRVSAIRHIDIGAGLVIASSYSIIITFSILKVWRFKVLMQLN